MGILLYTFYIAKRGYFDDTPIGIMENQFEIYLETADLYEPPLDMFGADVVEKWFNKSEIDDLLRFTDKISLSGK